MQEGSIQGFELSPQQKRLWSLRGEGGPGAYHAQAAVSVDGPLDVEVLRAAVAAVVARHEILRTRFSLLPAMSRPVQVIGERPDFALEWEAGEVDEVLERERSRAADPAAGPVLRIAVVERPPARPLLVFTLPALCADRRTLRNLVGEIERAYTAPGAGEIAEPVQYADISAVFCELLQGPDTEAGRRYWQQQLPPAGGRAGSGEFSPRVHAFAPAADLQSGLTAAMERRGASPFDFFLTCWAALLWHRQGRSGVVIGAELDGRSYEGLPEALGPFSRYLPVSPALAGSRTLAEVLEEVRQAVQRASERQDYFEWPSAGAAAPPFFPFCFELRMEPAPGGLFTVEREVVRFDRFGLLLICRGGGGGWSFEIHYDPALHTAEGVDHDAGGLLALLAGAVRCLETPIGELEAVGEREGLLLASLNETRRDPGPEGCLHRLCEAQAARTPDRVAAVFAGREVTFRELDGTANRLARHLRGLGVGRGVRVGLACEASLELVAVLLAVLKAGGAYVPLDPSYPRDRLAYICGDADLGLLIAGERVLSELPDPGVTALPLDRLLAGAAGSSGDGLEPGVTPDDLAYVIYTSGSTGRPKGVMVSHGAICNRLLWMQRVFPIGPGDRVLQKTPLSFDASIWELFVPLFTGATLVLGRSGGHQDPAYMVGLVAGSGVTILQLVPSMLQVVLEEPGIEACRTLRRVFCGGEGLPRALAERFRAKLDAELHNLYGPTESAIDASSWSGGPRPEAVLVPIGLPIDNVRLHVLNPQAGRVPFGAAGELYIGGAGLARGYHGRPDLTAERFLPDPFDNRPGERLYRTGDGVRHLPGGALEFLGRLDDQVKLRGNRIELGEVEAVLSRHPAVSQAVAGVCADERGDQRLVAWIVPRRAPDPGLELEALYRLPNGLLVAHLNRLDTDLIYREIFEDLTYARRGIELSGTPCVFDVGANVGLFTLFVHQRCPGARLFAFEPVPALFAKLRANVALYGIDAELFNVAVSRAAGETEFTFYPRQTGMSGLHADQAADREVALAVLRGRNLEREADELLAGRFEAIELVCPVRTLSEVISGSGVERIDLLKVDVEKSELGVLEGLSEEDWSKVRQAVIEVHEENLAPILALLRAHGFEVAMDDDGILRDTGLKNLYAVRRDRVAEVAAAPGSGRPPEPVWLPAGLLGPELRRFAETTLPAPMVPSTFVPLEALPRLPNGKVDRRSLPEPEWHAAAGGDSGVPAPLTPTQELLAGVWESVLGISGIGPADDFFELGGHSLLAMQVISRLREIGPLQISVRDLFESPRLDDFAESIEASMRGGGPRVPPVVPVARGGDLPLSFAQQRLFFIDQIEGGGSAYNVPMAARLEGELDAGALLRAFEEIVRRHESLRATFHLGAREPVQRISPQSRPFLSRIDLSALGSRPGQEELERLALSESRRPFDLARGPLLRVLLVRREERVHELIVNLHHIVSDGWSTGVLIGEIRALYEAFAAGRPSPLPELAIQYADFAAWQRSWLRGPVLEGLLAYWRRRLAGAPRLELPLDRPRAEVESHRGGGLVVPLSRELAEGLARLGREEGCTLFMTLLGAWQVLLSRWTGQDEVVVGTDVANRSRSAAEHLIGFFVNLLVLRTDLQGQPSFRQAIRRVRDVTLEAYAHQDLPFEKIVEELRPERKLGAVPFVQALFVLQNAPRESFELPGLVLRKSSVGLSVQTAKFDLALFVTEGPDGLVTGWNYKTDLFAPETIARLARSYEALLASAIANPDLPIDEMEMVSGSERKRQAMEKNLQKEAKLQALLNIVPKAAATAPQALVETAPPAAGKTLPLTVRPAAPDVDLIDWARNSHDFIERNLLRHGAMLFRGFDIRSVEGFERFAAAFCPDLFGEYGDLPSEESGRKVYKSTPYPADKSILFHNESSHLPSWPLKQFFFCLQAAREGGETPLIDCRETCKRIDPALVARFREKKLMYVRNFVEGVDVSWQDFFKTDDRSAVEASCRASGTDFEWRPDGSLRTRQVAPAVARHPKTGETVFFNQIQLHHASCLDEDVRRSLLSLFDDPWSLPRNVFYGDGTAIEDSVVDEIGALYREMEVALPWQEGDIILLDNMLTAHARNPFAGPRKIVVAMAEMIHRAEIGEV